MLGLVFFWAVLFYPALLLSTREYRRPGTPPLLLCLKPLTCAWPCPVISMLFDNKRRRLVDWVIYWWAFITTRSYGYVPRVSWSGSIVPSASPARPSLYTPVVAHRSRGWRTCRRWTRLSCEWPHGTLCRPLTHLLTSASARVDDTGTSPTTRPTSTF
jgi:hypothetical protein